MKKNKKGFVLIETIVTVVVLTTSLLYLYNSYSSIIANENTRLYYDDVAYIYKANYIRKFLEAHTNIEEIKNYAFDNTYIVTVGSSFDNMFTDEQRTHEFDISLENIYTNFNINQILLMDVDMINNCDFSSNDSDKCKLSTENLNYSLRDYIRTLNATDYNYYLVVEFSEKFSNGNAVKCTPGIDTYCNTYYVSLEV